MKHFLVIMMLIGIYGSSFSQGIIKSVMESNSEFPDVYCGSNFVTKHIEKQNKGFIEASNKMLKDIAFDKLQRKMSDDETVYIVPVVFHVIYNNEEENIPDSVIFNQIELLNTMYRRQNADTVNLREVFLPFVGDAKIEFQLADTDPMGNPTNGIVRTETEITNFGGILPYGPGQNNEIAQWVTDSLVYNMFRLTESELGGDTPWNQDTYLNIWTGDLRISEPLFNAEEIVFFALGTPPIPHPNWPNEMIDAFASFNQGVLVHYLNVGSNNPYQFEAPYDVFNGLVNKGKILVHEVGHYLGLRHIWGDGDCSMHDYIWDTPNATNHSQFACNPNLNTCTDTINGMDLPNMIENYMDYSSSDCQNAFTLGQIQVMREVLQTYRPNLPLSSKTLDSENALKHFGVSPNPTKDFVNITVPFGVRDFKVRLFNNTGQKLIEKVYQETDNVSIKLPYNGLFLINISYGSQQETHKIIRL